MNLVLLHKTDFIDRDRVVLRDHRHQHIRTIHRATVGDEINIGLVNGDIGTGLVTDISNSAITLTISLDATPPKSLPVTLVLALPRPKMLRRILQHCTTLGVKKIILINSYRVEKSYWQTPILNPKNIEKELLVGLSQAKDTILPEVHTEKRFKPFVEDRLPEICKNSTALVAHPYCSTVCPQHLTLKTVLVIGSEGGFIPYEIEKFQQAGCQTVHIGERILKVETAIAVLLSKLFF